jgi:hypothetical protein
VVGAIAGAVTVAIGLTAAGFDAAPNENGVAAGAYQFTFVLVAGVLVAMVAYGAVEWLQTRRLDSIARQFTTRTIVLMPVAIAINIVLGQTVGAALKLPVYLDSVGTILVGVLAGPIAGAMTGILSDLAWTFLLAGTPFGSPTVWPFAIVAAEIGFVAGIVGWLGAFRTRPGMPVSQLVAGVAIAAALIGALVWFGILPFYARLCAQSAVQDASGACFRLFTDGPIDPLFFAIGIGIAVVVAIVVVALIVRLARDRDLGVVIVVVTGFVVGVVSAFIAAPIATIVFGGVTASGTDLLVAAFQQVGSSLDDAVLQQSLLSDTIDKTVEYLIVFTLLGAASRRMLARFPQGERAIGTVEA